MLAVGTVGYILLLLIEYRVFDWVFYLFRCPTNIQLEDSENGIVDDDVMKEKSLVRGLQPFDIQKQNLVLMDMTKIYGKFVAVNQLAVRVHE